MNGEMQKQDRQWLGSVSCLYKPQRDSGQNQVWFLKERVWSIGAVRAQQSVACKAAAALRFVLYVASRCCVPAAGGNKASCRVSSG